MQLVVHGLLGAEELCGLHRRDQLLHVELRIGVVDDSVDEACHGDIKTNE